MFPAIEARISGQPASGPGKDHKYHDLKNENVHRVQFKTVSVEPGQPHEDQAMDRKLLVERKT